MRRETFDRKLSGAISRREALRIIGLSAAAGLAVACSPSAPSGSSTSGSAAPKDAPWAKEWNDLVAAAQKEGTLNIQTPLGAGFRRWLDAFQQAFPGIAIEHSPMRESDFAAKGKAERDAGIFSLDAAVSSPGSVGRILRP